MGTRDAWDAESTEIELLWRLRSWEAFRKNDCQVSAEATRWMVTVFALIGNMVQQEREKGRR